MFRFIALCILFYSALLPLNAQAPVKRNAAEIYEAMQRLNVLGSVLYVAAHPDDENTNLLSYLSNFRKFDARYLSLTRGDGGQNLIGPEQAELLGVIRTQELLRARGIDGAKQAFSRANDFGFSKTPDETLKKWDRNKVLSDVVWAIRKYQPDIIINRFTTSTERPNHGHHTSSAIIGLEAYDLAADPNAFPEQLKYVSVWKPTRYLTNVSWWFYGGKEKFETVDKSKWQKLDIGVYYPLKGRSNTEIAAESRSQHRCQGMGTMPERGEYTEWFEFMKGEKSGTDLFDGINTGWSRLEKGAEIGNMISRLVASFNFEHPENSVSQLLEIGQSIDALPESKWKSIKQEELKAVLQSCLGLYLEASAADFSAAPGEQLKVIVELINRSNVYVKCREIQIAGAGKDSTLNLNLPENKACKFKLNLKLPTGIPVTNAYWLNKSHNQNMFVVDDQQLIGLPETPRELKARFLMEIGGQSITFEIPIAHKYEDPIRGEIFRPLEIIPPVSVSLDNRAYMFSSNAPREIRVTLRSGSQDSLGGEVGLKIPSGWQCKPKSHTFSVRKKGEEQLFSFELIPPKESTQGEIQAFAAIEGVKYSKKLTTIQYDHIPAQMIYQDCSASVSRAEIKTEKREIAYIMGAGDEIPQSLRQIGFDVTVLEAGELAAPNFQKYDVVIMGIRAYNTVERLKVIQPRLYEFVENGGTMIVQYNNNFDLYLDELAPFKLKLSRDRVTNEDAEVTFLQNEHPVLNYPNKIGEVDFTGWVQERGLYFPSEWDERAEAILACNDTGESAKKGGLLVAKVGKGHYIYTGLSFFRQLPAGVPGAYRLFSNLVCLGKKQNSKGSK
jgi:LmbE family N-acetylglucosaminyl deacetylase